MMHKISVVSFFQVHMTTANSAKPTLSQNVAKSAKERPIWSSTNAVTLYICGFPFSRAKTKDPCFEKGFVPGAHL